MKRSDAWIRFLIALLWGAATLLYVYLLLRLGMGGWR